MAPECFDILFEYLKTINGQGPSGRFWELIVRTMQTMNVQAGEPLATHLGIPSACWFLARGMAMEYIYDDMGQKTPLRFFRKEPIIPTGFVEQKTSPSNIEMTTPGTLLALSHRELQKLFRQSPEANEFFHFILADYARRGRERERLLLLPSDARIRYLHEKQQRLILTVPGKHLARYLNMSPYTYSRLRNSL